MNNRNSPSSDDPYRDPHTGGDRRFGQPAGQPGRDRRDPFEDSLAETWDAPDASVDRRLRSLVGPVTPLYAPPYGFERVVLRARRRRNRAAFIAAAAGVLAVAVAAGGVVAGTHLAKGSGPVQAAGCDNVGQSVTGAGSGGRPVNLADVVDVADVRGGPSGVGAEREIMDRKYEWAIGGVLTAAALSAGIVAGCSSSATNNGASANGSQSGSPSASPSGAAPTTPAPSTAGSGSATATTGANAGASASGGNPRCHTTDLSPTVSIVAGSQGAGHESINIELTNNSGHTCTVYGFPGMMLQAANGAGLATNVTRNHGIAEDHLTVPTGSSVATTGRIDFDVPAADEPQTGNCEQPSVYLEITPPDETTQLSATITGGPVTVCEHGTIDVLPFVAGTTGANQ